MNAGTSISRRNVYNCQIRTEKCLLGLVKLEIMGGLDQSCTHLEVEKEVRCQVYEASEMRRSTMNTDNTSEIFGFEAKNKEKWLEK